MALILAACLSLSLVACGGGGTTSTPAASNPPANSNPPASGTPNPAPSSNEGGLLKVGFAQVGHEPDWRTASTKSAQKENIYSSKFYLGLCAVVYSHLWHIH